MEWRDLPPWEELEEFPLFERIVEVLRLCSALANLGKRAVDMLLAIFLGPCAPAVFVSDIDNVPAVGQLACTYDAAVFGDDVTAPDHQ